MPEGLIGPIIALVAAIIVVGGAAYGVVRARQATRKFSRTVFGTDTLAEGFAQQEEAARATPKSVSAMTSVELPRIMRDFPEFDYPVMKRRAENVLTSYLDALTRADATVLVEGSPELRDELRLHIRGTRDAGRRESFKQVAMHRMEITSYRKQKGRCLVTFQGALQCKHAVEDRDGKVVSGSKDLLEQQRWEVELAYVQDIDQVDDLRGTAVGVTCPNCGAPIDTLGEKTCPYCGIAVSELNIRAWAFTAVRKA